MSKGNEPKRIQRKRTKGWRMPERAVYVGRPTRWGNPYRIGDMFGPVYDCEPIHNAGTAVLLFDRSLRRDTTYGFWYLDVPGVEPESLPLDDLRGRDLACWCPLDQPCHADVLLALANDPAEVSR